MQMPSWPDVLGRLIAGEYLTSDEASAVMREVFAGNATSAQLASLLTLMRARGETVDELAGFAKAMIEAATPLPGIAASTRQKMVDTCGTGGDHSHLVNVSTMAAFVVAAAGVPVCKHGNRAASSETGSADVLEQLGVAIDLSASDVEACIEQVGIGFCFAPRFHPAMRHAMSTRKELGVRTAFNLLGPLSNPGRVQRQVVGVSDPSVAERMLGVLQANGAEHAMIVFGHDGLDELSLSASSTVHELSDGEVRVYDIDPTALGFSLVDISELRGGDPEHNADRARKILAGEPGPQADLVALNAAAAFVVAGTVDGFADGADLARSVLSEGKGAKVLEQFASLTQSLDAPR